MSRLDRHIAMVRNKLALDRFFHGLAWACVVVAGLAFAVIVIDRLFALMLPRQDLWLLVAVCAVFAWGVGYAVLRRPTAHEAAVAIDERLALKEKFSTALYARSSRDPFAQAAVRDAEYTAEHVSLHKRFPLSFPRAGYLAITMICAAFLTSLLLKPQDLFGRQAAVKRERTEQQERERAERAVREAIARINAIPKAAADERIIDEARRELEQLLKAPISDPAKAHRTAAASLASVEEAMRREIEKNARFALAQQASRMLRNMGPISDQPGPARDAQEKMMRGQFAEAAMDLQQLAEQFQNMDPQQQEEVAQQMELLAEQLRQLAEQQRQQMNPQQMAQQLQNMGVPPDQAQEMAEQIQQAAQGDTQAQQQLQQALQQMQQAGNQQGAQQLQQMVQQMQQQAGNQAQSQQLAQAAQAMAQAMQQMAQTGAAGQNSAQAQQQMAQAQQALQQQLQQMGATQADLAAMQAQLQQLAQAAQQQAAQCQGGPGQQQAGAQGQWGAAGQQQGAGMGGEGQAMGARDKAPFAPGAFVPEKAPTQDNEQGQLLAVHLVQSAANRGESRINPQELRKAAEQEIVDEVNNDFIPREVRKAVGRYFGNDE